MPRTAAYSPLRRSTTSHEPSDEPSSTRITSYVSALPRATRPIHATSSGSDSASL